MDLPSFELKSSRKQKSNHNNRCNNNKGSNFSFAKDKRFALQKSLTNEEYYFQIEYKVPRRRFNMGIGSRSKQFQNNSLNPSPASYNAISQFDKKWSIKKGFSFGTQRDDMKFQNYLKSIQKTPAPGEYDIAKNRYRSYAYSLRGRTSDPQNSYLPKEKIHPVPGPGQYKLRDQLADKFVLMKNRVNQARYMRNKAFSQRSSIQNRNKIFSKSKQSNQQKIKNIINESNSVNQDNSLNQYGSVNLRKLSEKNKKHEKIMKFLVRSQKFQKLSMSCNISECQIKVKIPLNDNQNKLMNLKNMENNQVKTQCQKNGLKNTNKSSQQTQYQTKTYKNQNNENNTKNKLDSERFIRATTASQ